jgi:hypothetical protein
MKTRVPLAPKTLQTSGGRYDARSSTRSGPALAGIGETEVAQREGIESVTNSPRVQQSAALVDLIRSSPRVVAQRRHLNSLFGDPVQQQNPSAPRVNRTGLPDQLKSGVESLSGISMDGVKVHYNSDKPVQLNAHAYAQGSDIHLAPGQEQHLSHEAWHVVQQKQGRVKPTMQMKNGVLVNDNVELEREADLLGSEALQVAPEENVPAVASHPKLNAPVQRVILDENNGAIPLGKLQLQISAYPEDVQEIILELHGDEEAGYSLKQALEIAMEQDGKEEVTDSDQRGVTSVYESLLGSDIGSDESDSDYDEAEAAISTPAPKPRKKRRKEQNGTFVTTKTFKGAAPRAPGDGVKISREEVGHPAGRFRTTAVSGYVRPAGTKGRPSAPEPDVDLQVGIKWKEVGTHSTRNTGLVDAQKGHIMALELGGPDIPENIVPQWAQWQSNGVWREAEKAVLKRTIEENDKGNEVFFECELKYKNIEIVASGSRKSVFFPSGFKITIWIESGGVRGEPIVMFDEQQAQDETDDKMAHRVMDEVDKVEDASDSGDSSHSSSDTDDSSDSMVIDPVT